MPNLSDVTKAQWALMRASTSIATYQVLDALLSGPKSLSSLPNGVDRAIPDLLKSGMMDKMENGDFVLTEIGRKHLDSF